MKWLFLKIQITICYEESCRGGLYHSCNDEDPKKRHQHCPPTAESWCKFQKERTNFKYTYKEKVSIDKAISDLGSDVRFKKCQHGQTQSANESLYNVI